MVAGYIVKLTNKLQKRKLVRPEKVFEAEDYWM
jgi:hypothetical protein